MLICSLFPLSVAAHTIALAGGLCRDILRYDAVVDVWAVVGELSEGRRHCGVAVDDDGGIFIVGGKGNYAAQPVVERFDTRTLQLTVLPPLPEGRRGSGVLVDRGVLHVLGGWTPAALTSTRLSLALTGAARWVESRERLGRREVFAAVISSV